MSTSIRQFIQSNAGVSVGFEEHVEELNITVPEVKDVEDEELYEAEDTLDEVEKDNFDLLTSIEMYENVQNEAEEMLVAIENYVEVLELGIESGQFSAQFAAVAGTELQRMASVYGGVTLTPALEDFNHDNLDQFYAQSLEGFKDVVKSVQETIKIAASKTRDFLMPIKNNEKAAKALNTKADALLAKIDASDIGTKRVPLKKLGRVFTNDGQVPSNLLAAISTDQKGINTLATKHLQNCVDYYIAATDVGSSVIRGDKKVNEVYLTFAKKPTPNEQIAKSVSLLGASVNVGVSDKRSETTNKGIVQNLLGKLNKQSILTEPQKAAEGNITLTKEQVVGLAKAVKVYAGIMETMNREARKELGRQIKKDKDLLSASANHGVTMTGGMVSGYGGGGGSTMGVGADLGDEATSIRAFGRVLRISSTMPSMHFREISQVAEYHAKSCLQLADRAVSGKATKEETKDDE